MRILSDEGCRPSFLSCLHRNFSQICVKKIDHCSIIFDLDRDRKPHTEASQQQP